MSAATNTEIKLGGPVDRSNLFETIADRIEEIILSGRITPGQKLPPEAQLAAEFSVSRPVIREALARLRERGLATTITGRGTFARASTAEDLSATLLRHLRTQITDSRTAEQLYEARSAIELMSVELAALRADDHDLAAMKHHLLEADAAKSDNAAWTAADSGFHMAIAAGSKNLFLMTLLGPLRAAIETIIAETQRAPDAVRVATAAHRGILDAVERHDPASARIAMEKHLHQSQQYLIERYAQKLGDKANG